LLKTRKKLDALRPLPEKGRSRVQRKEHNTGNREERLSLVQRLIKTRKEKTQKKISAETKKS